MTSPYIDFYFEVKNCLDYSLSFTGKTAGDIWNPGIEQWHANWNLDTSFNRDLKSNTDNTIRIRWFVPQGNNSPMTELAFRSQDQLEEQILTFEDMRLELVCRIAKLVDKVGWLKLPTTTQVIVPNHPIFNRIRRDYDQWRHSNG